MPTVKREFIPNQVFVGLPWKTVRPKYDRIIPKLEKKYPLHFTIVGRNDSQVAQDLFDLIKQRISSCSYALFDASGGNANVSLEFGFAEGIDIPRAIFLSAHKSSHKGETESPIISDLTGRRRTQYKTEKTLSNELNKLCREHPYTRRYEKAVATATKGKPRGAKKSGRALVLKAIRAFDGKTTIRRAELVQALQALGYKEKQIESTLKKLHSSGILKCTVGKYSDAYLA